MHKFIYFSFRLLTFSHANSNNNNETEKKRNNRKFNLKNINGLAMLPRSAHNNSV